MDCLLSLFMGKLEFHFHNGMNVFRITLRSNCKPGDIVFYYYVENGNEYVNRVTLNVASEPFRLEFTNRKD